MGKVVVVLDSVLVSLGGPENDPPSGALAQISHIRLHRLPARAVEGAFAVQFLQTISPQRRHEPTRSRAHSDCLVLLLPFLIPSPSSLFPPFRPRSTLRLTLGLLRSSFLHLIATLTRLLRWTCINPQKRRHVRARASREVRSREVARVEVIL